MNVTDRSNANGRTTTPDEVTGSLVGFARTLRTGGVDASPDRVLAMVAALALLDGSRSRDVYWAGRLTLCAAPEDLPRYDAAFRAWFGNDDLPPLREIIRRHRLSARKALGLCSMRSTNSPWVTSNLPRRNGRVILTAC